MEPVGSVGGLDVLHGCITANSRWPGTSSSAALFSPGVRGLSESRASPIHALAKVASLDEGRMKAAEAGEAPAPSVAKAAKATAAITRDCTANSPPRAPNLVANPSAARLKSFARNRPLGAFFIPPSINANSAENSAFVRVAKDPNPSRAVTKLVDSRSREARADFDRPPCSGWVPRWRSQRPIFASLSTHLSGRCISY